jgi:hypothetical protein
MADQNQQNSKQSSISKTASLVAVSMLWFGLSFLLPFFGIHMDYEQTFLTEKVLNRATMGDGIADLILNTYLVITNTLYDTGLWRSYEYRMLSGSSPLVKEAFVSTQWQLNILIYRVSALMTIFVALLPFGVALLFDAYYFREKGKWTYFLPSPTRHRFGQLSVFWSTFISVYVFLAIPFVTIPTLFVVLGVVFSMVGAWMWIAHTQKRI